MKFFVKLKQKYCRHDLYILTEDGYWIYYCPKCRLRKRGGKLKNYDT